MVIKAYCHMDWQRNKWNKRQSPDTKAIKYEKSIDNTLLSSGEGELISFIFKLKKNRSPFLEKSNCKWMKTSVWEAKPCHILKDNIRLVGLGVGNGCFKQDPSFTHHRYLDKFDFIKSKNCSANDLYGKRKYKPQTEI